VLHIWHELRLQPHWTGTSSTEPALEAKVVDVVGLYLDPPARMRRLRSARGRRPVERADTIIVGGGIAGSTLAAVLARSGVRVLVLEKTKVFKDENRGELLWPWGVRESQKTDLLEVLFRAGGHAVPGIRSYSDLQPREPEVIDLAGLIPGVPGSVNLGHPNARQALLDAAAAAGADVVRGVQDVTVTGGSDPSVRWQAGGATLQERCRLVIGADGRLSRTRRQAGIDVFKGAVELYSAGMLIHGSDIPSDANVVAREADSLMLSFPQRGGFARLYHCFPVEQRQRFNGRDRAKSLIAACDLSSLPDAERWLDSEPAGPCSTFPCSDTWVESPIVDGIVLIGDAAGYNNFLIGQGLSMAFRDVAVLSQLLLENEEWSPATLKPYGEERMPRLKKARYLAHLSGWRERGIRDEPDERAAAKRLAAKDELLAQFEGSIPGGYEGQSEASIDAMWARLDQLEGRIDADAAAL
jgi:2-polyprenyl-6-methoxyphenol hydroxylase-like FAD-dependent oxidoreductase